MIVQQCEGCMVKGKKAYCSNCNLKADYFEVYSYNRISDRFGKGTLKLKIKAYTWNDVLDHIKSNFFNDTSEEGFNINCEKDFAYIEVNPSQSQQVVGGGALKTSKKGNQFGFKVYLIDYDKLIESPPVEDRNFFDLTKYLN